MRKLVHAARIARDLFAFAKENKRWWLVPLAISALLLVGLVVAAQSPVAPFLYTLF